MTSFDSSLYPVPVPDSIKDSGVGCSGCKTIAPFTIRGWEENDDGAQLAIGWQVRLIITEVILNDRPGLQGPARTCRWDFYCPDCAGDWSPRPDGAWTLRMSEGD